LGHNDEAKEHFLHEYRENPGNTDVILALADLDLVSAAKDQAMARFKQIIELDPTHSDALFGMGQLWLERNEAAKALEAFEAIYAIDDEQSIPTLSLRTGEALLKLGKYQQALTRFEAAARIQGDDQLVQLRLGECFFSMQRLPEAAACFRRVLNAESGNAAAHHNLGLCLLRMGRAAAGLEHCRRSLQLKPDSVAALRTTAAACLRLGRWKEAKSLLRHAQSIAPDDKIILSLISATWRYRLRHLLRRVLWPFRGPSRTIDRHA